jgi:LuxR family transcriptional regulator, maltose regulon positive regulatory protein
LGARSSRQPPAQHPQPDWIGVDEHQSNQPSADAVSPGGPILLRTKLHPPPVRAGLIPRARLDRLLEEGAQGRLCLIDAPAGSGKTTLLAQWSMADQPSRRVAWVSLDEGDDDPVRFWAYVIEAFRVVQPALGEVSLKLLQGAGAVDLLTQVALPQLLNELATVESELVLTLDDYHLVTNPDCHETLAFFVDHLPANVHLLVATRVDPPLPLSRLRASGELVELRIAELEFTSSEATTLLNQAIGLELTAEQVQRLWERTEGWAAGLYLAGLSLRDRANPSGFIASFEAGHRHIVDYLGTEVLARQPEPLRSFMVHTSILERLSGPLCDAVLEAENSAALLAELEQANLFLIALDDHRQWYRHHHLFAQLLRLELAEREPALVPVLHHRAADWYRDAGDAEAAIYHATAAGEFSQAGDLIARHWLAYQRQGRVATLERWLAGLPEDVIAADPPIALIAAWVGSQGDASIQEIERWLAVAEGSDYQGPLPAGIRSVPFGVAMVRSINVFDDVGGSLRAARQALDAAGPRASESYWMGAATLGRNLYLSGLGVEAQAVLEDIASNPPAADQQPFVVVNAFALLSLLAGGDGAHERAMALARRAMDVAEAQAVRYDPLNGVAYIALAQAVAGRGGLAEAEQLLEQALHVLRNDSYAIQHAQALVELAGVRHARGDTDGAHAAVERARQLITSFQDPGMLPSLLDRTERALGRPSRRRPLPPEALTDREQVVLRLLATTLSQPEIAQELHVSVNTVRTHIQGIYRKLGVASRQDAIATAREHDLPPRA